MKMYDQTIKDKPIICLIQLQFVSASKYFNRITEYKAGRVVRDYLVRLQALELPVTPDRYLTSNKNVN